MAAAGAFESTVLLQRQKQTTRRTLRESAAGSSRFHDGWAVHGGSPLKFLESSRERTCSPALGFVVSLLILILNESQSRPGSPTTTVCFHGACRDMCYCLCSQTHAGTTMCMILTMEFLWVFSYLMQELGEKCSRVQNTSLRSTEKREVRFSRLNRFEQQ